MNIIRNLTGVLIALAIINTGIVVQAHADDATWSLDSFYQTIGNIPMSADDLSAQTAVTAQANVPVVKAKAKGPSKTMAVMATAYSSSVDETDSSPFITAQGTYVRDGIIAANFLPFGTAIKIPAIYGDKIFLVEDRMNQRYTNRIDLWFPSKQAAYQFGIKKVVIEIVS